MKHKSNLLMELGMSAIFLVIFCIIRFLLMTQLKNVGVDHDAIAVILVALVIVLATLIYLASSLRRVFSFSANMLILSIAGYFLWDLSTIQNYLLLFCLVAFALLTTVSAVTALRLFRNNDSAVGITPEMMELHDFMSRCLPIKVVILGLGVLLIEIILVP